MTKQTLWSLLPDPKKSNVIIRAAVDIDRFRAGLTRLQREQLPYATALALTDTACTAASAVTKALPSIFAAKGRAPTPFTMRAVGVSAARKNNPTAIVFIKRLQAGYLAIEETGGVRVRASGAPVLTPVDVLVNAYGNIPRGLVRRLAANPEDYFLGRVRGVFGLWERVYTPGSRRILRAPRGLRLLVAFHDRAVYRPRFGLERLVEASVREQSSCRRRYGPGSPARWRPPSPGRGQRVLPGDHPVRAFRVAPVRDCERLRNCEFGAMVRDPE